MDLLVTLAVICWNLVCLLGTIDGLYFHLWKYQLYAHPATRYEHKLHTLRAALFIPTVWLLFGKNYGGALLWLGVTVALLDTFVEGLDMRCELRGRTKLGGLSTGEYVTHLYASGLRLTALTLVLAAKPRAAWHWNAPLEVMPAYPQWMTWLAFSALPGSLLAVGLHLWLLRPKYQQAT